jgi:hypothetical protein
VPGSIGGVGVGGHLIEKLFPLPQYGIGSVPAFTLVFTFIEPAFSFIETPLLGGQIRPPRENL